MSYLTRAGVEEERSKVKVVDDQKLGRVEVIQHKNGGLAMTNGHFGGWVQQKDGSLVSVEYAKSLNRTGRRKLGIKL